MNFEYHIYQYLLKYYKAEVPDFGVFELTKESAKIDAENSIIMPPKEVITFEYQPSLSDRLLVEYIAQQTNADPSAIQADLKNAVRKWIDTLLAGKRLVLENLGHFQLDEHKNVIKITHQEEDVFGLEAINLQTLKNPVVRKNLSSHDYSLSRNVIWTFLVLIMIGSGALFLFGDQQVIFGKSSEIPARKIIRKNEAKASAIPKQDSTKTDSLKQTTNAKVQKISR